MGGYLVAVIVYATGLAMREERRGRYHATTRLLVILMILPLVVTILAYHQGHSIMAVLWGIAAGAQIATLAAHLRADPDRTSPTGEGPSTG